MAVDTDKAWKKVYSRLQKDGLIVEETVRQQTTVIRNVPMWMKWAASFLVLVTTGLLIFLTLTKYDQSNLLTLINNDNNTMVQVLHDGSIVYLADNSSLTYPSQFNRKQRIVSLKGEAFFDVKHNPDKPFIVETETLSVTVLGTSFNIKTDNSGVFEMLVEDGLVKVNKKLQEGQSMEVRGGEFLRVTNDTFFKTAARDMTASSWKTSRMHFKDETLENVLSVISRNYNTRLYIEQGSLKDRRLTVTFYNNALPTIIELICLSMDLEVVENSDASILFKPKT